jgi:predicted ATP-dependent endonuclease of OLD family
MQLERIRIEGLFGRFTHDIRLRRPEKITILHAPNGFGKTAVLTLIDAFFSRQFYAFFKYQFRSLQLYFDHGEVVELRKESPPDLFNDEKTTEASAEQKGKNTIHIQILLQSSTRQGEPLRFEWSDTIPALNRHLHFLDPAGPDQWYDENTSEMISTREALSRYANYIPPQLRKGLQVPEWLAEFLDSSDCRLIETQRLLRLGRRDESARISQRRPLAAPRPVVEEEARDLANRIGATLAQYANRAQTLDQSFPRRVLAGLESADVPLAEEVSQRLRNVEQKRSALIEAGLLDRAGAPEILSQAELAGTEVRQVIGVYLNDVEQKFSQFDELFQRVSLFKEIISEKFQFKSIAISREKGINVKTEGGSDIGLSDLSSGEQHELVLLYELLFGVKDNALILIDEPELSLHVGWQIRFLPDLQRIQKLKPLQIILATHSPQIINDRWDLTVELK